MNTKELVLLAANYADDKKAENIDVIDLKGLSSLCDYVIIATVTSRPHLEAVEEEVTKQLKQLGVYKSNRDGSDSNSWRVSDYGNFMLHLMTKDAREFYALDKVFSFGDHVRWQKTPEPKAPAAKKSSAKKPAAKKAPVKKAAAKKVPAKKAAVKTTKKTAAKKTAVKKVAKKAAVKKVAAKKPAVKKTITKKVVAKKTAVKKTAVKKAPAKKTVAKKPAAKTTKKPAAKAKKK
ncbi:ribosome-associated protein [Elusimicrobium simillimum]|uniref:ribosome silencing factor n=1 Tax=Elusimicrobium simillimum TaxID=3143438 RepID=UPI003C704E54